MSKHGLIGLQTGRRHLQERCEDGCTPAIRVNPIGKLGEAWGKPGKALRRGREKNSAGNTEQGPLAKQGHTPPSLPQTSNQKLPRLLLCSLCPSCLSHADVRVENRIACGSDHGVCLCHSSSISQSIQPASQEVKEVQLVQPSQPTSHHHLPQQAYKHKQTWITWMGASNGGSWRDRTGNL